MTSEPRREFDPTDPPAPRAPGDLPASPPSAPDIVEALEGPDPVITVELRPPRRGLESRESMDAWIDLNHAVRRFTAAGRHVLLTDDAVGQAEEENLAHLSANLAEASDPGWILPFLTCKHTLEYCLLYAERAAARGLRQMAVLGGDPHVGAPRCVDHAYELRAKIRERVPALILGGWANPHRDPDEQAGWLASRDAHADFFLTQVVSHHDATRLEDLIRALRRRDVQAPGLAGVFHYRSANPDTLERLGRFFPVPAEAITRDFDAGHDPETLTARSIRAALNAGAAGVYVSNLGIRRPHQVLAEILERL